MACSVSFSHLDRVTPPLEEINHIWAYLRQVDRYYIRTSVGDIPMLAICLVDWNFLGATATFWDPVHAVFNIQGTELTPTIEEYRTLVGRIAATRGIVEPNFHTTQLVLVFRLLGVHKSQLQAELAYSGDTEIVTAKLLRFIEIRTHEVQGDLFQKILCHAILFLIFRTLLFPRSAGHIDATLASCAHPNFVSSGHACARLNATRLGSVHLPGDARRTQVRRSRHLPFYDPKVEGRQVTRV
ncbi:hypothetical protein CDL15_Pgr012752 [Punica granatum]|uniref:DUF7745 domain-containing protein n=1 Tax=Punica granatum TaxID=22663 RepID=A0A218XFL8_PUNGR|nr:hypothetical protein CDL15_Pgr012752 [Punica granatum]